MGRTHALMPKKHTEGHALTYLKYVTIASFDPRQLSLVPRLLFLWEGEERAWYTPFAHALN